MGDLSHISDDDLFYKLSEDESTSRKAFEELYNRYSSRIFTYCRKILQDEKTAEDIFHEAFIKFYESASKDRVMTNTAAYLLRIARNLCLNEKKKKYNSNVSLEDFSFPSYDEPYATREMKSLLESALEALPDDYREVLVMKEYLGLSYKEIGETLGVTLSAVRTRIFRAKNKMRKILEPYLQELQNK